MNVTQVMQQLNRFIDEADTTYVTDADRATWLELGYNELRERVVGVAPEIYMKNATLNLNNSPEYDLANPPAGDATLLGPNATERLYRVYRLAIQNDDNTIQRYLPPYADPKIFSNMRFAYSNGWTMVGSKLLISSPVTGKLRMEYVPFSTVDWTKFAPADNEFIDDLSQFHSIIPLLAAQYYQVADGASNAVLDRQLQQRLGQLDQYITQARTPEAAHYVEDRMTDWYNY
tara:strand:- start:7550 stop:8242 length:693 start_codon:yes stop_codon:yes gene_type:complete